jgi:N-acetyl-anhydromuramyl-L-alanine amidase AmpD
MCGCEASQGQLTINLDYTQYKKAPTFAIGCECLDRQPSEKERPHESRKVYRHGRSSGHYLIDVIVGCFLFWLDFPVDLKLSLCIMRATC